MQVSISVPDDVFARVSASARGLGISRSEFFALAASRYLDGLDAKSTTHEIDVALAQIASPDGSARDAVTASRRVLNASDEVF